MRVTNKFLLISLILSLGTLICGLVFGDIPAILFFAVSIVVLAILLVLDIIKTPKPNKITVFREMEVKLSLNADHIVAITVLNHSDKRLYVEVRDDIPEHFEFETINEEGFVSGHYQRTFSYRLKPLKRGEFIFPAINYRYKGVLGFITRQGKDATPATYKVYPNMKDISKYSLSALSKNIFLSGIKKIRTATTGGEFDSLRAYNEGDSEKTVNWKATARKNELIVNTYVPERNQYIYVLLDASRVMNSVYNNIKMIDYGINASFLLADHCIRGGDNIGLIAFDSEVRRVVKPGKGAAQFSLLAEELYNVEENENSANYDEAFSKLSAMQKRRSLVFIFTELFNAEETERFAKAVKNRLKGHLVYSITMKDPRIDCMAKGEGTDDVYLKSSSLKFMEDRKAIAKTLSGYGIHNIDVEPDKLSLAAVAEYLNVKRQGIL